MNSRQWAVSRIAVVNREGRATIKVDGKTVDGDGPFAVSIEGGKVDRRPGDLEARVELRGKGRNEDHAHG